MPSTCPTDRCVDGAALSSYQGRPVLVAGAGVSGAAAARVLRDLGATVTVAEASEQRSELLRTEGFTVADLAEPPPETSLVVTSPGWRPSSPLLVAAAARGVEVIGEVELAWRLRPDGAAPWLAVTGTNGKTTTVRMLASVLAAAGHRTVAAGNVGLPLLEAVLAPQPHDVLAVELSSFQLHWSRWLRPYAAAVLNVAPDHLDWHGSFEAYASTKAAIWTCGNRAGILRGPDGRLRVASTLMWVGPPALAAAVGNADEEVSAALLGSAHATRRVTFTLGVPGPGQLGVVAGRLVDRAFPGPEAEPVELAAVADLSVPAPHNVANALAAAALAGSFGVPPEAVRAGLRAFVPDSHRNALVATFGGVAWVDDSKATNPHAAAASLAAYPSVVWVAGGLLKGADVEALVRDSAARLRAVVLLGTDRAELAQALGRHAPKIPVAEVERLDTGAMSEVVELARALARPGDTVLLAPAAASMDCFRDYRERGELFAAAVRRAAGGAA